MIDHETVEARIAAGETLSDEERAHADGCLDCGALARTRDEVARGLEARRRREPRPGFDARVLAHAASRLRTRRRMAVGSVVAVGLLAATAIVLVVMKSRDAEVAAVASVEPVAPSADPAPPEDGKPLAGPAGQPAGRGPEEDGPGGPGAAGGPKHGFGLPPPLVVEHFADELGLKPAQKTQLRDALDELRKKLVRLHADREIKEIDLRREFMKDDADEKKLGTMIDELGALEAEGRKLDVAVWLKIRKLLTKEQRTKLDGLMEKERHDGPPSSLPPPPLPRAPR